VDHLPARHTRRTAESLPWDAVKAAGLGVAIDAAAAEVVTALRENGIRSILLKGPSFDEWLYEPDEPRLYVDIDVLVDSRDVTPAGRVLEALGYRQRMVTGRDFEGLFEQTGEVGAFRAPTDADHAKVWIRAADRMYVDLHRTLIGVEGNVDPWEILSAETDSMLVAGTEIEILNEHARALHVALHAVHGGDNEKPMIDLSRALERLPSATWEAAAVLAERLGALSAFGAGLRLQPAGAQLAGRLDLPTGRSVETVMFTESVPYSSWTVNRLAKTPGLLPKLRILARRAVPEPEFMRVWYPVARRGRAGLGLAYVRRLAWLFKVTGPAVRAWWRASRGARRSA
jgi:Uncharacterised nucleotidyltransferase